MKALIFAVDFDFPHQLALVYLFSTVIPLPILFAALGTSGKIQERLWPTSQMDELSRTQFIHDHATVDVDTSLVLVDLEQKRLFKMMSEYFELVRQRKDVGPLGDTSRTLLSDIGEFLTDLQGMHPMQGVEDRNALMNRQRLLSWLDDAVAALCTGLVELSDRPTLEGFQANIREGVDGVFLCMGDAMESDDRPSWMVASQLTGDRGELMRKMRVQYLEREPPLQRDDLINILLVTNAVEEVFFLLSKPETDFNPYSSTEG